MQRLQAVFDVLFQLLLREQGMVNYSLVSSGERRQAERLQLIQA